MFSAVGFLLFLENDFLAANNSGLDSAKCWRLIGDVWLSVAHFEWVFEVGAPSSLTREVKDNLWYLQHFGFKWIIFEWVQLECFPLLGRMFEN